MTAQTPSSLGATQSDRANPWGKASVTRRRVLRGPHPLTVNARYDATGSRRGSGTSAPPHVFHAGISPCGLPVSILRKTNPSVTARTFRFSPRITRREARLTSVDPGSDTPAQRTPIACGSLRRPESEGAHMENALTVTAPSACTAGRWRPSATRPQRWFAFAAACRKPSR